MLSMIFVLMLNGAHAQSGDPKLDDYFTRKMKKADLIGLQVASIGNGELVWQGSYGLKEINTGNAVNDSTLFQIASVPNRSPHWGSCCSMTGDWWTWMRM